nr:MAG TPA: hypothetical protein [Caudoviricetes sp.]
MESTVRLRLALFSQVRDVSWNIRLETLEPRSFRLGALYLSA